MSALPADAGTGQQLLWLFIAIVGAMVIAAVIGVITGVMVTRIGAHPILVTLATMMTLNGIGIWLTKGAAVSGMPPVVQSLGSDTLLGMPLPLWVFRLPPRCWRCSSAKPAPANASTWAAATSTPRFSGINTHRMVMLVYVISSLLCVLAGLIMMARFNSARMGYGDAYLLLTVLAIILGGTDPNGGFGRVTGVVLALIALQVLSTGFNLMNISQHVSLAMWGAVLVVVLAFKQLKARFNDHRAVRLSKPAALNPLTEKGSMMRIQVSPSLMCMNLMEIKHQLAVLDSRADFLHIDIMDGHYVKNITLSPFFIEQIRPHTRWRSMCI